MKLYNITYINPVDELEEIQNGIKQIHYDKEFELDGILCLDISLEQNYFLLESSKLYSLKSFLEYLGLRFTYKEENIKKFYDENYRGLKYYQGFKEELERNILQTYSIDNILDKINERGINSLTPLDKYILRK